MKTRRRTMLFSPASSPKMLSTSYTYGPDCLLFDLEDSVPYNQKLAARDLLSEALKTLHFGGVEIFARINALSTEFGEEDARELVAAGLRNIRLPMCEGPEDMQKFDALLEDIETQLQLPIGTVRVQASIETPRGVYHAHDIARSSERLISLSFGAEDFTRELGVSRTREGQELFLARSQIVMAAHLSKLDAIDTSWTNLGDEEGFLKEVQSAKTLGFAGKSCIHPSQIDIVHQVFAPNQQEVAHSLRIMKVVQEKGIADGGVILVDGKMVDIPIIKKAEHILRQAGLKENKI